MGLPFRKAFSNNIYICKHSKNTLKSFCNTIFHIGDCFLPMQCSGLPALRPIF